MTSAGFTISGDDHPISPVMLGDAQLASDMADDMLSKFPFKKKKKMYLFLAREAKALKVFFFQLT